MHKRKQGGFVGDECPAVPETTEASLKPTVVAFNGLCVSEKKKKPGGFCEPQSGQSAGEPIFSLSGTGTKKKKSFFHSHRGGDVHKHKSAPQGNKTEGPKQILTIL